MVKKYPDLERGESASITGREHIPPRLFKQAVHLNRQRDIILQTLKDITPFNAGRKSAEVAEMINKYISEAEDMRSALKVFEGEIKTLQACSYHTESPRERKADRAAKYCMKKCRKSKNYAL